MEMIWWMQGLGLISLAGLTPVPNFMHAQNVPAAKEVNGPEQEIWRFDKTSDLGGHEATVLGHPRVIDSPYGKAVEFNGVDGANDPARAADRGVFEDAATGGWNG